MWFDRSIRSLATAVAITAVSAAAASTANAQSFWLGTSYGDNSIYDVADVTFSPKHGVGEIIVSFSDRRLYYVTAPGKARSYPIAVPRPESRWNGVLRVSMKRENPDWVPTPKMRRENPDLPAMVVGGHKYNPLGVRALYLGSSLYRIHGTDAPWTIGKNVSKGCIRMHNDHVIELYNRVGVGTKVTATWQRYETRTLSTATASSSGTKPGWERRVFGLN